MKHEKKACTLIVNLKQFFIPKTGTVSTKYIVQSALGCFILASSFEIITI